MKRKNFRLDKNKIYAFIGRAVVYSSAYVGIILFGFWAFCQKYYLLGGEIWTKKLKEMKC